MNNVIKAILAAFHLWIPYNAAAVAKHSSNIRAAGASGSCNGNGDVGRQHMKVIAVASQKGGSGKTTLAGHLAVQAERMGAGPVALVDTDPQGSLAEWWNVRQADTPAFVATGVSRLEEDIRRMRALGMRL